MRISIYQINHERDINNLCFVGYDRIEKYQGSQAIDSSIYDKVFEGDVQCNTLEDIYQKFNADLPDGYKARSLSVSDIIEVIKDNGETVYHFVDSWGFKNVSFEPEKTQISERFSTNISEKIKVLLVEPNKYPKVIEIENTLQELQKLVGGYIETFTPFEDEIALICNEEGKLTGLPLNRAIYAEPEKTEMTYSELKSVFRESELKGEHLTAHIIFTEDTFDKPYTEFERTYVVNSNNKAFQPNMGGYSIYAGSLDGVDRCVRLERYMADEHGGKNGWKIEKCYLVDDEKEMIEIMAGTFIVVGAPVESENFTSLTHEQTLKYGKLFESPERFYKDQNKKIIAEPFSPVRDDNAR